MAKTAEQYQSAILQLPPPGWAVNRDPGSYLGKIALGWAQEMARLDRRVDDLMLREVDPRYTYELLPDWERMVGLPDPCCGPAPTVQLRRLQLLSRLNPSLRGQSIPIIIQLASLFGYTITVTEPQPFCCDSSCDDPLYDDSWAWTWIVNAATSPIFYMTCDSNCDEPLAWWGDEILECVIRRRSPPETNVLFTYGAA